MSILLLLLMFMLGLVGSFFSGLLGIGGAIINYPLFMFVPSALGVAYFTAHEVAAISMFQVFFASLSGLLTFYYSQRMNADKQHPSLIHRSLVLYLGISTGIGGLIGGSVSGFLSETIINMIYGILAVIAVILMLIPSSTTSDPLVENSSTNTEATPFDISAKAIHFPKGLAIVYGSIVGLLSGIVGAGGAFILIPIMLTLLKIPMRITIASSLAIILLSSLGGLIGKVFTDSIPWTITLVTIIGSLIGAMIGSNLSSHVNTKYLRYGLLLLISATAIHIWISIL